MIIEYKLDKTELGRNIKPAYVQSDGDLLYNEIDKTYIGFSPLPSDGREYKIPDSVLCLTSQQVRDRSQVIHALMPYLDTNLVQLTTTEVDDMVDAIIAEHEIWGSGKPSNLITSQKKIDFEDSPFSLSYLVRTLFIDASGGNVTVDLPTAVGCAGLRFMIVLDVAPGANTVIIDGDSTEKINADLTYDALAAQYDFVEIESNGVLWFVIGHS